jgi:23S rRNA pseudouridine2457 synthase
MIMIFHKPYGVLSQFTPDGSSNKTLAEFGFPKEVYPLGRLDADSEGLLLLSDEVSLNTRLLNPERGHSRCYWAQVEGVPTHASLDQLSAGVVIQQYTTRPCRTWLLDPQPKMTPRIPPIRVRKNIPDCWIALELTEGKNRQVRKMTATIGYPTLRLIRVSIGKLELGSLPAGSWRKLADVERELIFQAPSRD